MKWTAELGNAFLAQHDDVMDAVQRMRKKAHAYGYLRTNAYVVVSPGPYITIVPVNPYFVCVPVYDPLIVFAAPAPGFFVAGAIHLGYGITFPRDSPGFPRDSRRFVRRRVVTYNSLHWICGRRKIGCHDPCTASSSVRLLFYPPYLPKCLPRLLVMKSTPC